LRSNPAYIQFNVTNTAPYFDYSLKQKYFAQFKSEEFIVFPSVIDNEKNPTEIVFTQMYSFIQFDIFTNVLHVNPIDPNTDLGIFTVNGFLSDSRLQTPFTFDIEVYNRPPELKSPLEDQSLRVDETKTYTLPSIEDFEGLPVRIEPTYPLPLFIRYYPFSKTFKFSPVNKQDIGTHEIEVCFTDDYSPLQCDRFNLVVKESIIAAKSLLSMD
jgi:hypothetical protein